MNAGTLRHRLIFQNPLQDMDSFGAGGATTWVTMATVWGNVTHLIGREAANIKMVWAEASHRIDIRFLSGITARTRITLGTRIFNILEINQDKRHLGEMTLIVREKL
jgi:SPP1 family predicted phage head-tail adaptor